MRKILVELRCLHPLKILQGYLSNLVENFLICAYRLQYLIDKLCVHLIKLPDCFNLSYNVLLEQKLEQPIVLLLFDFNLPYVLHVRVHSYPEHRRL